MFIVNSFKRVSDKLTYSFKRAATDLLIDLFSISTRFESFLPNAYKYLYIDNLKHSFGIFYQISNKNYLEFTFYFILP